jgi:hypothetical protein
MWKSAKSGGLIPAVHSTASGSVVATCPTTDEGTSGSWQWVPPDGQGKVAAWGECLINFTAHKTFSYPQFQPLSISGTTIYGTVGSDLFATTPGSPSRQLPRDTARPWGIAGTHAIVVHDSVLYALDKSK